MGRLKSFPGDIDNQVIRDYQWPLIKGDVGRLEKVVMNPAVNARKAMPDGGSLTMEAGVAERGDAHAAVHDGINRVSM